MRGLTKISLLALAAVLMAGTSDAAFAARKKHRAVYHRTAVSELDQRQRDFNRDLGVQYDDNDVPIIMKGFNSGPRRSASPSSAPNEEQPRLRADRPIPRGSGYVPSLAVPPNVGSVRQQSASQPILQPYNPPQLNTFGDRVTNCIHSYPLNAGIGNNPRDQQSYIRQCAN
jgi:hypothetical protein